MQTETRSTRTPYLPLAVSTAALALFLSAGTLLHAQQAQVAPVPTSLHASLVTPLDLSLPVADASSSSSVSSDPVEAERFNLSSSSGDALQPPPRRTYGRPRYNDRMHNADGSYKLSFAFGGGFVMPTGNSSNVFTTSYNFRGGVGYNFSKKLGVMAEFGYDHFGLQGSVISSQANYYNQFTVIDPTTGQQTDFTQLDANAHVTSLTINPTYKFHQGESLGAYVLVGGGYYHKAINFTLPQAGYYCDYYGFCYQIVSNQNFDTHTANGGGFNAGAGVTYKLSRFSNAKLYAEARYVWSDAKLTNDQSPISTLDNTSNSYIPITFGIRW